METKNLCMLSGEVLGSNPGARLVEEVYRGATFGQAQLKGDMSPSSHGPITHRRSQRSLVWIEGQSRQRYRLVILSVSSGQSLGSVTSFLERSWTLFFAGVSRWRVGLLVELLIQKEQCCFCPASGLLDQLYTLARVPEGAWEFAQPVYMCFVDLDKA